MNLISRFLFCFLFDNLPSCGFPPLLIPWIGVLLRKGDWPHSCEGLVTTTCYREASITLAKFNTSYGHLL